MSSQEPHSCFYRRGDVKEEQGEVLEKEQVRLLGEQLYRNGNYMDANMKQMQDLTRKINAGGKTIGTTSSTLLTPHPNPDPSPFFRSPRL